jgi:hypothetical protein
MIFSATQSKSFNGLTWYSLDKCGIPNVKMAPKRKNASKVAKPVKTLEKIPLTEGLSRT